MKLFQRKVRIQTISIRREEFAMLGFIMIVFAVILIVNIFNASSKGKTNNISQHDNSYYFPPYSGRPTDSSNTSFFDGGNDCGGSSDSGGDCGGGGE
jgi:uncharacterized membrane protein YgcG